MKFHRAFLAVVLALTCLAAPARAGDLSTYSESDLVYFEKLERDLGDGTWNAGVNAERRRLSKVYYSNVYTVNLVSQQMLWDLQFVESYFRDAQQNYARADVYHNERVRRGRVALELAAAADAVAAKKAAARLRSTNRNAPQLRAASFESEKDFFEERR